MNSNYDHPYTNSKFYFHYILIIFLISTFHISFCFSNLNLANQKHNVALSPAIPPDSPFSKLYLKALSDEKINKTAVEKAFKFLFENKDKLNKTKLCLGRDNITNREKIRNQECLIIADYTKSKMEPRLHIFKFKEDKIYTLLTAHGKGSNTTEKALNASKFSNISGSLQTSLGFYLTDHPYSSVKDTFGPGPNNGVKLDGLECTNNNARKRFIVMHTAKYVPETLTDEASIDYSEGCITLAPSQKTLMLSCAHGALLYNHADPTSK